MPSIVEAVYLWDSQKTRMRKRNQDFANVIATFMIFFLVDKRISFAGVNGVAYHTV